ncbi:PAS domain-containing serine/threonine-protein kinase [Elysia marginata]|uniref:PAS domain-containing serine/threonine-protein kinase n=1 Tax=Elysia marginata TaxID=1093978 RepID=A0AAV4JZN4_9GAST|nr:PAS domain-containing serine/threonine-protein kinase [Elysia marginata]
MDFGEIITRLNYVGELLQSIQHFTSSNMHACCCDVCTHITSLKRTCVKRALEEIKLVSQDIRSKKQISFPTACPNLRETLGLHSKGNNNQSIQDTFHMSCRLAENQLVARANPERENAAPLVLSSTMKDSGLQATASSSDCSASPIYDADSASEFHPNGQHVTVTSSNCGSIPVEASELLYQKFHQPFEQQIAKRCDLECIAKRQCKSLNCFPVFSIAARRSEMDESRQSLSVSEPGTSHNVFCSGHAGSPLSTPINHQPRVLMASSVSASDLYNINNAAQKLLTSSVGLPATPTDHFASNETPHSMTPCASGGLSNCSSIAMDTVVDVNSATSCGPISKTPMSLSVAENSPSGIQAASSENCKAIENKHLIMPLPGSDSEMLENKPEIMDSTGVHTEVSSSHIFAADNVGQQESDVKHLGSVKAKAISFDDTKNSSCLVKTNVKVKALLEDSGKDIPHQLETSLANLSLDLIKDGDKFIQRIQHHGNKTECDATASCLPMSPQDQKGSAETRADENQPKSAMPGSFQPSTTTPHLESVDRIYGRFNAALGTGSNKCPESESDLTKAIESDKAKQDLCETKEAILGLMQYCTEKGGNFDMEQKSQTSEALGVSRKLDILQDSETCPEQKVERSNSSLKNTENCQKTLTSIKPEMMSTSTEGDEVLEGKYQKNLCGDTDKENKFSQMLKYDLPSMHLDNLAIISNYKSSDTDESQILNEKCDKDCQENFSSPKKVVRSLPRTSLSSTRKTLWEDQSLKCVSNFEFSPRKSYSQEIIQHNSAHQRSSLPSSNCIPSELKTLDSNEGPQVLFSPQKRPSMGIRRSLDMNRSNRNNNTNILIPKEKKEKLVLSSGESLISDIKTCNDETNLTMSSKICGQNENLNCEQEVPLEVNQPQRIQKPAWGAPAICASQYFSQTSVEIDTSKHLHTTEDESLVENIGLTVSNSNGSDKLERDGIEQTVPIKRSQKIECFMFQPSNLEKGSHVSSKLVSRHHLNMIMESSNDGVFKHQSGLNTSLPVSLLKTGTQAQDLDIQNSEKGESFEGNQSFPKTACSDKQSSSLTPYPSNHGTQKLILDKTKVEEKRKSNLCDAEKTPRNRRSIFGLSPPDQHPHGKHKSPPHRQVKERPFQTTNESNGQDKLNDCSSQVSQEKPQTSSEEEQLSSGSEGGPNGTEPRLDHLTGDAIFMDFLWEALDVSMMLAQSHSSSPTMQEILFNTVTSSLCVVDKRRSGKIVSVNESFQLLIGLHEKVVGQRLLRFLKFTESLDNLSRSCPQSFVRADGSVLSVTGLLAKCVDSRGSECLVSVWMLPLSNHPHLAVCSVDVITPFTSDLSLLQGGQVVSLTLPFEEMLGCVGLQCVVDGVDVNKTDVSQNARFRALDFEVPVTVVVDGDEDEGPSEDGEVPVYHGNITLFGNLCGLLVVRPDGRIIFSDDYFAIFLGYSNFFQKTRLRDIVSEVARIGQTGEESTLSVCGDNDILDNSNRMQFLDIALRDVSQLNTQTSEDDIKNKPKLYLPVNCFRGEENLAFEEYSSEDHLDASVNEDKGKDFVDNNDFQKAKLRRNNFEQILQSKKWSPPKDASTPLKCTYKPKQVHHEDSSSPLPGTAALDHGIYKAMFLHANGDQFFGSFKVGSILTSDLSWQYCVWVYLHINDGSKESSCQTSVNSNSQDQAVARQPGFDGHDSSDEYSNDEGEEDEEYDKENLKGINKTVDPSLGQIIVDHAVLNQSHNATSEEEILDLESAIAGAFYKVYFVREALGQGSFGFVRRAMAIDCKKSAIVKFIKKCNMFSDSWTVDVDSGQKIPLEVAILKDLDSEYIIKVLDVYQNADFVQMVMEDFGDVDLFDFIDQVSLDEPLACHLFRQILWGVDYLHSNRIVHRDIKDENVVLRRDFRCKLIDFGSAVYLLPGEGRFSRFRGTMEYCSPEVFCGESYRGPELDMWALGVTLYTMVYRVNPFSVDEMPEAFSQLEFPDADNDEETGGYGDMLELMYGLLQRDPLSRYTMNQALHCEWLRMIVNLNEYCWDDLFGGDGQPDHSVDVSRNSGQLND